MIKQAILKKVIILVCCYTFIVVSGVYAANNYYVHFAYGSDANPGTLDRPLKHHPWMSDYDPSGEAPLQLLPGDVVLLARGQQWIRNETDDHMIIIQNNGSEKGGYIKTSAYGSGEAPSLKIDTYGPNVIYGYGDVSYIWFDSLHIQHYSSISYRQKGNGIVITGDFIKQKSPHHIKVTNCEIDQIPSTAIKIDNGHHIFIGDIDAEKTASENDYSNNIHDFGYAGISLSGTDYESKESHFYIYFNYVHDSDPYGNGQYYNAYGIVTSSGYKSGESGGFPNHVFIRYNHVENIEPWEGIDTHGAFNWYCQYNYIRNCNKCINVSAEHVETFSTKDPAGPHYIEHNTCVNDADFYPVNYSKNRKPFVGLRGSSLDHMLRNVYFKYNVIFHETRPNFDNHKDGVIVTYAKNLFFEGNRIYNSPKETPSNCGIRFMSADLGSIENVTLTRNHVDQWQGVGIQMYAASLKGLCRIDYNLISTSLWPIHFREGLIQADLNIMNNTIVVGSGPEFDRGAGLYFEGNVDVGNGRDVGIKNNIFYVFTTSSKMYIDWVSSGIVNGAIEYNNNLYYGSSKTEPFRIAGKEHALSWDSYNREVDPYGINDDPKLLNPENDNFYIDEYSPCIDAGVTTDLMEDIDGVTVPQGVAPDIGAYEWSGAALTVDNTSASSSESGSSCFIATAAYSSNNAYEVRILRLFRDRYLVDNQFGKDFVQFYYRHSPEFAYMITGSPDAQRIARIGLQPIIGFAYIAVKYGIICAIVVLSTILVVISLCAAQIWHHNKHRFNEN